MTDFFNNPTKEQLSIRRLRNAKLKENSLRDRLFLLSGCSDFGNPDGLNGACVECSYKNEEQWKRCSLFRDIYRTWKKSHTGKTSKEV